MHPKLLVSIACALIGPAAFSETYALVIGVADYPEPKDASGQALKDSDGKPLSFDLKGCVNDANSIANALETKFAVPSSNIELLTDSSATESGLISALKSISGRLKAGDTFFFYFSGHGTRVPTKDKVSEPDGMDEVVVLQDCIVSDKSFRSISDALNSRGVHTTIMFDSCFSGGMSRTVSRLTKSVTYAEAKTMVKGSVRTLPVPPAMTPRSVPPAQSASRAFVSAGKEDQPTMDLSFKGGLPAHGAFTLLLLDAVNANPSSSLDSLIDTVRKNCETVKLDQVPQLDVSTYARRQEPLVPLPPALKVLLASNVLPLRS